MRRFILVALALAAAVASVPHPAMGDTRRVRDRNDTPGFLDVKFAEHRHGARRRKLVHEIETFATWRSRRLKCAWVGIEFRWLQRWLQIDYHRGALRARLFDTGEDELIVRPRAWRPDRRSVAVRIRKRWLGQNVERYRWRVETFALGGGCPEGGGDPPQYSDHVPNRGAVLHRL